MPSLQSPAHLAQGRECRAEICVRAGAISDPRGQFGERGGARVAPVAEHHGGVVSTVADGSSCGGGRGHAHK